MKKKILLSAIVLCTLIAAGIAVWLFAPKEDDDAKFYGEYYHNKVTAFTEENKTLSNVDIAFIGDSITDGYAQYGNAYSDYKVAWRGISGDTTTGLYDRLDVSLYAVNPKIVVLLIGINNIDTMFEDYEKIISDITHRLPDSELIIQSLHPTSKAFSDRNERILSANEKIKNIAAEYGCTYVDTHSALKDASVGEYSSLYTDDGLHPNANGYEKITEVLLPIIKQRLD
ncbi:MAG: hypothetical protein IJX92_07535 [Clostridia bacterium]|nr:hypothetical protein [Clostridia bacterium]